jgi:hypothetical protein
MLLPEIIYFHAIMTVKPVPNIPPVQRNYLGSNPPAGLVVLERPHRVLTPAGMDGNGLPPDTITPYSGIYDANGKLPTPVSNCTFIARV